MSTRRRGGGGSGRPPKQQALRSSTANQEDSSADLVLPTFYNTSFHTHRLSPLHTGHDVLPSSFLPSLARNLRDILVGDTVRGVYVGLEGEDSELSRVGSLESVRIDWILVKDLIETQDRTRRRRAPSLDLSSDAPTDLDDSLAEKRALWVEILYDSGVVYEALMIPGLENGEDAEETNGQEQSWSMMMEQGEGNQIPADSMRFLRLPLLLTRMNSSLRLVFIDWLSSEFDCRISPLRIGTNTIVRMWERWIRDAVLEHADKGKDVAITLGFHLPHEKETEEDEVEPLGIRKIDIMIPPSDVARFITAGKQIPLNMRKAAHWKGDERERRKAAGDNDEEGWGWRNVNDAHEQQPFTEALAAYLDQQMALDLFHPGVRITKIACPGFVLTEGRIKVFEEQSKAVRNLLADLARRGRGDDILKVF